KAGQPGKGIAWLSDPYGKEAAGPGDPRHLKAIVDTNRWLARRFKGNGNLAGFEVPYNEPHSPADSAELDWRRITAATILPIITEDPARLTFGMPPAWGHSNVLPSTTWSPPPPPPGATPHPPPPHPLRSPPPRRHPPPHPPRGPPTPPLRTAAPLGPQQRAPLHPLAPPRPHPRHPPPPLPRQRPRRHPPRRQIPPLPLARPRRRRHLR